MLYLFTKKIFQIFFFLYVILSLGCATLFNGTQQNINVSTSNNKRVRVIVTDGHNSYKANIPTSLTVHHTSSGVSFVVKDPHYQPSTYVVNKNISGFTFLNLFNVLFYLIDFATGAIWTYPNTVIVPVDEKNHS